MRHAIKCLLCLVLLTACPIIAHATKLQDMLMDIIRVEENNGEIVEILWFPSHMMAVMLENDPSVSRAEARQFLAAIDDYTVMIVVAAEISDFGNVTAKPREQLLSSSRLTVNGIEVPQLEFEDISQEALMAYSMFKPMFANMLGQLGESVELVFYPNTGEYRIDPLEKGLVTYEVLGSEFQWRLPLGSLLPPMIDLETDETFPGNYLYNPFTGNKLTPDDTPKKRPEKNSEKKRKADNMI